MYKLMHVVMSLVFDTSGYVDTRKETHTAGNGITQQIKNEITSAIKSLTDMQDFLYRTCSVR